MTRHIRSKLKFERLKGGAFTLIELLLVIAMIAILAAMLLPAHAKPGWTLAADHVACMDGAWAGFGGSRPTMLGSGSSAATFDGVAPHQRSGTHHTDVSNEVMADGSVGSYKWEKLLFLSDWTSGGSSSRMFYWYQQDLPAGMTGSLTALAPTP